MKKIIFIFLSTIVFSACSDQFLETENKNYLDVGSFFKTENDLLLAVNTAYSPLTHRGVFGLSYFKISNTLDPYLWWETPGAGFDQMIMKSSDFEFTWEDLYRGLFRTSDILANINRLENVIEPTKYKQYRAQLTALRAMYYFYLVTWFDKPIYYDETNVPTNPLIGFTNGTPEQFWSKIEEDLTYSVQNLPTSWPTTETGRITAGAANAQLGKALLYKHFHYYLRFNKGATSEATQNLTKAKAALKAVIDSKNYALVLPIEKTKAHYLAALLSNSSYLDIPVGSKTYKSENNSESVWEIQFNDNDRAANTALPGWKVGGNQLYEYFSPLNYRNLEIDPTLWYQFETAGVPAGFDRDPRAFATCYLEGDTLDWRAESGYKIGFQSAVHTKQVVFNNNLYNGPVPSRAIGLKKYYYPQFSRITSAPSNVRLIRYADVLLMYAELALLIDNDADGSGLAALNEVRSRAGMPSITTLNRQAIVHERDLEFAIEGIRYHDILRWSYDAAFDINFETLFKGKFDKTKNMYFPIPQKEIDANNGLLKQNPGW